MRTKRFIYSSAVLAAFTLFIACSSESDTPEPDPIVPGSELSSKTYEDLSLYLSYNGDIMIGKKVDFVPSDGKATLTLSGQDFDLNVMISEMDFDGLDISLPTVQTCGVLPGSPSYSLTVDLFGDKESCTFKGEAESEYCTFSYSGTVSAETLVIELKDVALKNTSISGTWNIPEYAGDVYNIGRLVWDSSTQIDLGMGVPMPMGSALALFLVMPVSGDLNVFQILSTSLKRITFGQDGNITANYLVMEGSNAGTFAESPKNIAQYVVTGDNKLLLFLNPQGIAYADMASKSRSAEMTTILGEVIKSLIPLFSTGLPLGYGPKVDAYGQTVDNPDIMSVYLGTEMLLPILKTIEPVFEDEEIVSQLAELIASNEELGEMAPIILAVLKQLPEIINTTTKVEIGINLQK